MARDGKEIDVTIGGVGFRLATGPDLPYTVETLPVRKEQLDTEAEPGEQSLSGWWRRSQASFHEGAGHLFQESRGELVTHEGFYDSKGVDVWTKSKASLLRRMVENASGDTTWKRCGTFRATGEPRRNLCTSPGLEGGSKGHWGIHNGSAADTLSIAVDTTTKYSGSYSLKVTLSAWDSAATMQNHDAVIVPIYQSLQPGTTYTVSLRYYTTLKSDYPGVALYLNGITEVVSDYGYYDEWVYLQGSFTASSTSDELHLYIEHHATPLSLPTVVYIDEVLVEEGIYPGPYFDGNSTGATWSGTPNLSVSELPADGGEKIWAIGGSGLYVGDDPDAALTLSVSGTTYVDTVIQGDHFYLLAGGGYIYGGRLGWTKTSNNLGADASRIAWGKHRLWVIGGRRIWQPSPPEVNQAAADPPIYVNPAFNWTYTCIAEGPEAMYFGGHDGINSSIQAITLNADGSLPTLSGATTTVSLPNGELVQEIATLAGQYIGIGTNKGFRVGVFDGASITYGPLLISPDGVQNCTAITAFSTYFLVAFEVTGGAAEAWRVDISEEIDAGVFPYARDIEAESSGYIKSLSFFGADRAVALASSGRLYTQHATELVSSGYLRTGRIRFRMSDAKLFKYLDLDTDSLSGSIEIDGYKADDSTFTIGTFSTAGAAGIDGLVIPSTVGPQRHISLEFTFNRDAIDATKGPVLRSYLLKAMPAIKPQRIYTLPLMCYDFEQTGSGQREGYAGRAVERFTSLKDLEDAGDTITMVEHGLVDTTETVVIDNLRFVQTATPPPGASGRGGVIVATLRAVGA